MNRRPSQAPERTPLLRKDRNRRKPDLLAATRIGVAALLVAQGMRVVFASPRLRLKTVRVSGTQRLTPADVIRLGGVPVGRNIFRVNLTRVSRRLLTNPVFEAAAAARELPNTLNVTLKERVPALQVISGSASFHADKKGVVFEPAEKLTEKMPLLELPEAQKVGVGRRLPEALLKTVQDCAKLAAKERLTLRNLRVDGSGELWLNIATGAAGQAEAGTLPVRVGRPTELPQKFRDIRHALTGKPSLVAAAAYLNVMCAGRTAYMTPATDRRETH